MYIFLWHLTPSCGRISITYSRLFNLKLGFVNHQCRKNSLGAHFVIYWLLIQTLLHSTTFWFPRPSKIYVLDYLSSSRQQAKWGFHNCIHRHNDILGSVLSVRLLIQECVIIMLRSSCLDFRLSSVQTLDQMHYLI